MNPLAPLTLFGWPLAVVVLFLLLPPRRAAVTAFVVGWLFLPLVSFRVPGLLDYSKTTAVPLSALLGVLIFDAGALARFRPRWFDLPMVVWCLVPLASSMSNDLGFYDGLSAVSRPVIVWGIPYLIGRLYFQDDKGVRDLAMGVFIGGLAYVPLCLYEVRFSPQLHRIVYGAQVEGFATTFRFGGWRPTVFLNNGLMVGMCMCMAALAGLWLWRARSVRALWGLPVGWLACTLVVTAVLCKSTGALVLLALGYVALRVAAALRTTLPVLTLCLVPVAYCVARTTGIWSAHTLVATADLLSAERGGSLQFRLDNEDKLAAKAMERPLLGWGGWGRARVYDDSGRDISITDGLWIITLGANGLVGLGALLSLHLLPGVMLWRGARRRAWPPVGWPLAALLVVISAAAMIDNLMNAMANPVFILAMAAAMTCLSTARRRPVLPATLIRQGVRASRPAGRAAIQ